MTFEEFFKKKKIDLALLKNAEQSLFDEFESHFAQMGERSFDHTKKYWFNALRRKYRTVDEPKPEKIRTENQLAEQTIIESVSEQVEAASPKIGFKPKFKAASPPTTPVEIKPEVIEQKVEPDAVAEVSTPKLGFKPKFKTAATPTAQVENVSEPTEDKPETQSSVETPAPKLGFKPKFKSATTQPVAEPGTEVVKDSDAPTDNTPPSQITPVSKLGFKPKFKSVTSAPIEPATTGSVANETAPVDSVTQPENVEPVPKLGFKPKFRAAAVQPAPAEPTPLVANDNAVEPVEASAPKLGFKPKFRATTPKQEQEIEESPTETEQQLQPPPAEASPDAKPVYKPKFQARNFKPKAGEE